MRYPSSVAFFPAGVSNRNELSFAAMFRKVRKQRRKVAASIARLAFILPSNNQFEYPRQF